MSVPWQAEWRTIISREIADPITDDPQVWAKTAEHEAAHAVVGTHLGLHLHRVSIKGILDVDETAVQNGGTEFRETRLSRSTTAAVGVAAKVWFQYFRYEEYPDGPLGLRGDLEILRPLELSDQDYVKAESVAHDALRKGSGRVTRIANVLLSGHSYP